MRSAPTDRVDGRTDEDLVFVVHPTSAQRLVGALGWALCASPILVVAWVGGRLTAAVVLVTGVVAAVVFTADLVARRDVRVEVTTTGLGFGGRSVPWWAIDEVTVVRRFGGSRVRVRAFGTETRWLAVPRRSPLVPNRRFDDDAAVVERAWRWLHLRPTTASGGLGGVVTPAAHRRLGAVPIDLVPVDPPAPGSVGPSASGHRPAGEGADRRRPAPGWWSPFGGPRRAS